jgi:hypothetical protein
MIGIIYNRFAKVVTGGSLRVKKGNDMGIQQYNAKEKTNLIGYILEQRRELGWSGKRWAIFCRREKVEPFLFSNHLLELRRFRAIIDVEVIVAAAVAAEKEINN